MVAFNALVDLVAALFVLNVLVGLVGLVVVVSCISCTSSAAALTSGAADRRTSAFSCNHCVGQEGFLQPLNSNCPLVLGSKELHEREG
jgi:hypothetical protein